MSRSGPFLRSALLAIACLAVPSGEASAVKRLIGEEVVFQGVVRDAAGSPIEGLSVVLELRREAFRLLRLQKETSEPVRMVTRTDAEGRWELRWSWDGHYNRFAIAWGVPSPSAGEDLATLEQRDVSPAVDAGGPVVADLILEAGPWSAWIVRLLGNRASAEERQVFGQMGAPDRIEAIATGSGEENTWFYFSAGRAYRFASGRLLGVESFEPVAEPSAPPP